MSGGFKPVSPAVFESTDDPVSVTGDDIERLIAAARKSPNGRARLILHPDRDDTLHEMVIALPFDSCDHPHINFKSGKSFLALSGRFAVMHCSDDGKTITPVILDANGADGLARITRLRAPAWHTIIPIAGHTVFLETIIGPFTGNRFAEWFPEDGPEREAAAERFRAIARNG